MNKQILTLLFLLPAGLFGFDEDSFSLQRELEQHALEQQFSEQKMLENVAAELHKNLQAAHADQYDSIKHAFFELQETIDDQISELLVQCAPDAIKKYIAKLRKADEINNEILRKKLIVGALLLHGQPGVGKTELAKAIAQVAKRKFIVIDCPNLATKYQNSASENLKHAIEKIAATNQEYIIVLDEINGLINDKKIAYLTDDVGLALGTQLDKYSKEKKIIFIATTNKPEDLPAPLKSRFDAIIKVQMPNHNVIKKIYEIYSEITDQKLLDWLALESQKFSARDIKKICDEAYGNTLLRNEQKPTKQDFEVAVNDIKEKIDAEARNNQSYSVSEILKQGYNNWKMVFDIFHQAYTIYNLFNKPTQGVKITGLYGSVKTSLPSNRK